MARRRRHRRIDHGYIHTATIFPTKLARATGQESLSQVQIADDASGGVVSLAYRCRRLWDLALNQVDFLRIEDLLDEL